MTRVHGGACAALVAILACTPERGPRRDTGEPPWDHCGTDASDCPDPFDDGVELTVIEIEDSPNNSALSQCETTTIRSPGSDIDAAELNGGEYLTRCELTKTSPCENDNASASQAEGPPDATGAEETGTYTSLSGGLLRCQWDGDAAVTAGDMVTVIEVGSTSDEIVDYFRIRICDGLPFGCQRNSLYRSGNVWFSGADLF